MMWKQVGTGDVWVLEYQAAGYARTNCVAFGTATGYLVLSPAAGVAPEHVKFLEDRAPIRALLAPHPGHTLGLNAWHKLRPALPIYAAPNAIARLVKTTKLDVRDIIELRVDDPRVRVWLAPGMGDQTLFIEARGAERPVVYVDEILEDLDRYPGPLLVRPLMMLLGKGPGFHVNRGFIRFFVKDARALRDAVLATLTDNPHVIFAHGPVRSSDQDLELTRRLLQSIS